MRELARLGQDPSTRTEEPGEPPEVVFYTGCNVLKTPHIALLALDILDALDVSYQVLGGPSHCCGVVQMRTGDVDVQRALRRKHDGQARQEQEAGKCSRGARPASCSSTSSRCRRSNAQAAQGVRDDAVPPVSADRSSTRCARCSAVRFRCGSRFIGTPVLWESWKRPQKSCRRFPGSNWSILANLRSGS